MWNGATNWPVGAGHGCIGCSQPRFWDELSPIYDRLLPMAGVAEVAPSTKGARS
jgi:Ni,Fe-hydrogenase I small subunit